MEGEIFYPTIEEVLVLHATIMGIAPSSALDNVRDLGLLESALARPRNAAAYEGASLARQAATLLWGIVRNHPFIDGNKRTGYVATQAFLRANGAALEADEDAKFNFVIAVAERMDLDGAEAWIGRHLARWPRR
jgi:death on curing protein